jgi:hypothetical protein
MTTELALGSFPPSRKSFFSKKGGIGASTVTTTPSPRSSNFCPGVAATY